MAKLLSTTNIVLIGGAGLYLYFAKQNGWIPFGKKNPLSGIMGSSSSADDGGGSKHHHNQPQNINSIPPPSNTQPFSQQNQIDLGSGFHMPVPPGNGYIDGETGREIYPVGQNSPFTSTPANDPTPTDYGIYTQYLNGLRNEYQSRQQQQAAVAGQQTEGIGGDITTLPQPPTVGVVPYGFGGPNTPGMNPMPPPPGYGGAPLPPPGFLGPPLYGPPPFPYPPPYPYPYGYDNGLNVGPIHIGLDGINVGGLVGIGPNGINVGGAGGLLGGLLGGGGSSGGGLLGGLLGGANGGLLSGLMGSNTNNPIGNIGLNNIQQFSNTQNQMGALQQQIQDKVRADLQKYGIQSSNYTKSYATFNTDSSPQNIDQFQLPPGLSPGDPDFNQKLQDYIGGFEDYLSQTMPADDPLNPNNTTFDTNHPLHPFFDNSEDDSTSSSNGGSGGDFTNDNNLDDNYDDSSGNDDTTTTVSTPNHRGGKHYKKVKGYGKGKGDPGYYTASGHHHCKKGTSGCICTDKKKCGKESYATTFIKYDQAPTAPADINGINPTYYNMVSRNQPGGMLYNKLGNI